MLLADAMLGALARWLRVLGLDVSYDPDLDDAELVDKAVAEGRTILTRDRRLTERRLARNPC
ncbi:MAG TPA: Mut7-C RNAse domain-containing protein [Thermoanaerobaculia bacterium]|nr:Mut7-C RNAse domain-containing protein [Thermoanaerobaculia bacterium]